MNTKIWLVIVDKGERARDIVGRYSSESRAVCALVRWERWNRDIVYRIVVQERAAGRAA